MFSLDIPFYRTRLGPSHRIPSTRLAQSEGRTWGTGLFQSTPTHIESRPKRGGTLSRNQENARERTVTLHMVSSLDGFIAKKDNSVSVDG